MDPVTVITAALAAGAGAGVKDSVSQAVKDSYAGLRAMVLSRARDVPGGTAALEQHENDPETWRAPVAKVLSESGAADDEQIVALAQELLKLLRPQDRDAATRIAAKGKGAVAAHTVIGNINTGETHR